MIIKLLKRIRAFFAHLSHLHHYGVNPERTKGNVIFRPDGTAYIPVELNDKGKIWCSKNELEIRKKIFDSGIIHTDQENKINYLIVMEDKISDPNNGLLPCSICGSKPVFKHIIPDSVLIRCPVCDSLSTEAVADKFCPDPIQNAIERWNKICQRNC
jgi:hypothetical protein